MNRFLKSRQLDDTQRQAIADTLENLQIGDAEGRRIFVFALDYELTEYANYLAGQQSPVLDDEVKKRLDLTQLESMLRAVSLQVKGLSSLDRSLLFDGLKASDDYRRSYDDDYLEAFEAELGRIQAACCDASRSSGPPERTVDSRPEGRFVGMLAKAYTECFEVRPDTQTSGPFAILLSAIGAQAGLDLDFDDVSLKELIGSGR